MLRGLTILLFLIQLGRCHLLHAQVPQPEPVTIDMSKGKAEGWKVYIPSATIKDAENAWKRLCKTYQARPQKNRNFNEVLASGVVIPELGNDTFNLYAQFGADQQGSFILSCIELKGSFLNSHQYKVESEKWVGILFEMANSDARSRYSSGLKKEEKELLTRNRKLEKLYQEKKTMERDIQHCEQTIEERKKEIEENEREQQKTKESILEQQRRVDKAREELDKYKD